MQSLWTIAAELALCHNNPQKMPLWRKGSKSIKLARAHELMHLFYTPTNCAVIPTSMAAPLLPFTVIWSQGAHHIHLCHTLTAMLIASAHTHRHTQISNITLSALHFPLYLQLLFTQIHTARMSNAHGYKHSYRVRLCFASYRSVSVSTTLNYCRSSKGTLSVSMCVCVCVFVLQIKCAAW